MSRTLCPGGGKVSYHSEDQAKEARKTLKYKGRAYMANARVYKCPKCFRWHLTNSGY